MDTILRVMFVIIVAFMWPVVCLLGAGEAELTITVIDPSGHTTPFDIEPIPNGERVVYVPTCAGTHKVNATYCGVNVPGISDVMTCCYDVCAFIRSSCSEKVKNVCGSSWNLTAIVRHTV